MKKIHLFPLLGSLVFISGVGCTKTETTKETVYKIEEKDNKDVKVKVGDKGVTVETDKVEIDMNGGKK